MSKKQLPLQPREQASNTSGLPPKKRTWVSPKLETLDFKKDADSDPEENPFSPEILDRLKK